MLRKLMAAIRQLIGRIVMVAVRIGDKITNIPKLVMESIFGSGSQSADEGSAAQQATQQAQAAQESAERTVSAGDYAANLRGLARRRAEHKEIDAILWQRVPGPLADYLRGLSLPECEALAKADLKSIASYLEGKLERIEGVRTQAEVADAGVGVGPAAPADAAPEPTIDRKADFKARLAASIAERKAKPELRLVA